MTLGPPCSMTLTSIFVPLLPPFTHPMLSSCSSPLLFTQAAIRTTVQGIRDSKFVPLADRALHPFFFLAMCEVKADVNGTRVPLGEMLVSDVVYQYIKQASGQ